jgi:ATPase subunit of ABC transporter with duplicated ATPase domains
MPPSIILSNLSWSTPDGVPLFNNLNLSFGAERTGLVGRNGVGKTTLLRLIAGELRPATGTIHVSGTLGVLKQEFLGSAGETVADLFGARFALALLDRAEAGLADADQLAAADWGLPSRMAVVIARLGLSTGVDASLESLSGGQRTRAALAALIFAEPDFLILDEPTNNLDRDGRQAVIDLLKEWRGGAIVISHDREVLEEMYAIVDLTSLGVARCGGNYSYYQQRKAEELEAVRRDLAHAEKAQIETDRKAQLAAERKVRKDSAGRRARAKGGQPRLMLGAAAERAELSGGANARLREARRKEAQEAVSGAREKIEILQPLRMDIPSTGLPSGKVVLRLDAVTGGYDPVRPVVRDFSLAIVGPERVAITGPNGGGKTTLLALMTGRLKPLLGTVELRSDFAILDQFMSLLDQSLSIRSNFLRLNPEADENHCRAALARFRFRADDALVTVETLSGGQKLRAGLACALGRLAPPQLLILDEPTNYLDLDSIEALEAALVAYDGALLVVSHDEAFLNRLSLDRRIEVGYP